MDRKQEPVSDEDLKKYLKVERDRFTEDLDREKQRLADDLHRSGFDISRQKSDLMAVLSSFCGRTVALTCAQETSSAADEGNAKGRECGYCEKCYNWKLLQQYLEMDRVTYARLNAVLQLARVEPVTEDFFKWLFEPFFNADSMVLTWEGFERGVIRFRGYAMLRFGSFLRAYQTLSVVKSQADINKYLDTWCEIQAKFNVGPERESPMSLPHRIAADDLWFLGYLSRRDLTRDFAMYLAMTVLRDPNLREPFELAMSGEEETLKPFSDSMKELLLDPYLKRDYIKAINALEQDKKWHGLFPDDRLRSVADELARCVDRLRETRVQGEQNTAFYLSQDYIDVYVATSMRERWEFRQISDFLNRLIDSPDIKNLKLRIFDPTQAYLKSRYDKGLIEGLMVRRAKCTIYLVQSSDTLGKDSELAATLAQGKPVIAFVAESGQASIVHPAGADGREMPFHALVSAVLRFRADGHVDDRAWAEIHEYCYERLTYYRTAGDFLGSDRIHAKLLQVYTEALRESFKKRADDLRERHPLALQVELSTGVANGLLVVDSVPKCAQLLKRILMNELEFDIDHKWHSDPQSRPEAFVLNERISQSPFRVVTDHETLTSAFWTTYFDN